MPAFVVGKDGGGAVCVCVCVGGSYLQKSSNQFFLCIFKYRCKRFIALLALMPQNWTSGSETAFKSIFYAVKMGLKQEKKFTIFFSNIRTRWSI